MSRWSFEIIEHASAPPDVVYRVLADVPGWADWAPGSTRATLEREGDPPPFGPGAIRKLGGPGLSVREQILVADPPRLQSYTIVSGLPVKDHRADVELHQDAGGTRIEWRTTFDGKIPGTGRTLRTLLRMVIGRTARARGRALAAG